jgi:hypothetical protein
MNSKKGDYRVLPWHPGLDENTDYIRISEEDAKAVISKTKTGAQVIKEIFLRNRMEEIDSAKAAPAAPAAPAPLPVPPAVPVASASEQAPEQVGADLPEDPPASTDAPLDFSNMTVTGLHTLKVGDLRAFAREKFDLTFKPATTKDMMIDQLVEKMGEAK